MVSNTAKTEISKLSYQNVFEFNIFRINFLISVIQNIENVGGIYSVNLFKYFMYLQPYKWVFFFFF